MRQQQQGDVMFLMVEDIPNGAKRVKPINGIYILAEGEATGHKHSVVAEPGIELYEHNGVLYLSVGHTIPATHEEHGPITLTPGIREIGLVVEVDPFEGEIRQVRD